MMKDAIPLQEADPERLTPEGWVRLLRGFCSGPGHADLATLGPDPDLVRAASFAFVALSMQTDEAQPLFESVIILSPPTRGQNSEIVEAVRTQLIGHGATEAIAVAYSSRIRHLRMPSLSSEELFEVIAKSLDRTVVYVESASYFRYERDTLPEDKTVERTWVLHLARLGRDSAASVQNSSSYILLDAGRLTPVQPDSCALLEEGVSGHVGCSNPGQEAGPLLQAVLAVGKTHDARELSGALGAIAEAEGLLAAGSAAMLRAVALHGAGRHQGAWAMLLPHWQSLLASADNGHRLDLARIAVDAGAKKEAREALSAFDVAAADVTLLENALLVAYLGDHEDVEMAVTSRLMSIFPRSRVLASHLVRQALQRGEHVRLRSLVADSGVTIDDDERRYLASAIAEIDKAEIDYASAARTLTGLHPERADAARMLLAYDAARRECHLDVLMLCAGVQAGGPESGSAARLAIDTLEPVLLMRTENGSFVLSDELLIGIIAAIAEQVARDPLDATLRIGLTRLLSVEVLGTRGDAVLAYLLMRLAPKPVFEHEQEAEMTPLEEITTFLQAALAQFKRSATILVGVGQLPITITEAQARRLLPALPELVGRILREELHNERSIQPVTLMLHAAILVCQRAGAPRRGLLLLRRVAAHLAISGWTQHARDMAEHGLAIAGADPAELRLAWATFADVYHRAGNLHEALVAAVLALSLPEVNAELEEAWQEVYLLMRLFRDLGFLDEAEEILDHVVEAIGDLDDALRAWLESIRLTIEQRRFKADFSDETQLQNLIQQLARNVRSALEHGVDVVPPLVFLVQLVAEAQRRDLGAPDEVHALIQSAVGHAPAGVRARIDALGAPHPTLESIQQLAHGMSKTRFAEDIGYDIHAAALLAKRALVNPERMSSGEALSLLELLTDRAVIAMEGRELVDAARTQLAVEYLVGRGQAIHVLGLNEARRLVHLTMAPGEPPRLELEPTEVFDDMQYTQWKESFPYEYAFMDASKFIMADAVRRSVDHLGISSASGDSLVIVPDVALQQFPMNLLRCGDEFLGALLPVASVPSLDWVAQIAQRPFISCNRKVAWISDALPRSDTESPVLAPLADRLDPLFAEHGMSLTRAEDLPPDLRGADLAIVIAHGGLVPERRFFQVIRDDGERRWSPGEIARAIGPAGLTVLFVCSSGRHDAHPRARTAVGLTRRLLANGCRAVVASPWPLDVSVPPRWLPPFLTALSEGEDVTKAVFTANREVADRFSGNPPHAYAMHLYGDPTFRLPGRAVQPGSR